MKRNNLVSRVWNSRIMEILKTPVRVVTNFVGNVAARLLLGKKEYGHLYAEALEKERANMIAGRDLKQFNEYQRHEISLGQEKGLDIDLYADPRYEHDQMEQIRMGLEKGVDTSQYADRRFSAKQMGVLREALEQGVDVSSVANHKLTVEQMNEKIRDLKGIDASQVTYDAVAINESAKDDIMAQYDALVKKYPNINLPDKEELKEQLHMTLAFYGGKKDADRTGQLKDIELGEQTSLDVVRLGALVKDGVVMNVGLEIDKDSISRTLDSGRNLGDIQRGKHPHVTLYVNKDAGAKAVDTEKCFGGRLKKGESRADMDVETFSINGTTSAYHWDKPYTKVIDADAHVLDKLSPEAKEDMNTRVDAGNLEAEINAAKNQSENAAMEKEDDGNILVGKDLEDLVSQDHGTAPKSDDVIAMSPEEFLDAFPVPEEEPTADVLDLLESMTEEEQEQKEYKDLDDTLNTAVQNSVNKKEACLDREEQDISDDGER